MSVYEIRVIYDKFYETLLINSNSTIRHLVEQILAKFSIFMDDVFNISTSRNLLRLDQLGMHRKIIDSEILNGDTLYVVKRCRNPIRNQTIESTTIVPTSLLPANVTETTTTIPLNSLAVLSTIYDATLNEVNELDTIYQQYYEVSNHTPMTEDDIDELREYTFKYLCNKNSKYKNQDKCAITQETITDKTLVCLLPCDHIFKSKELKIWMRNNNVCPICKETVQINNYKPLFNDEHASSSTNSLDSSEGTTSLGAVASSSSNSYTSYIPINYPRTSILNSYRRYNLPSTNLSTITNVDVSINDVSVSQSRNHDSSSNNSDKFGPSSKPAMDEDDNDTNDMSF